MPLTDDWRHIILAITLCVPRLGAALAIIPLLSQQVVPGMIRNGVTLSFALFVYPVVEPTIPREPADALFLVVILAKETFIGLGIGYAVAVVLWGVESAGFFIDNQRGAAMAGSLNPMSGEQTSPLGILLFQLVAVALFSTGLFSQLLVAIFASYKMFPVWSFYPAFSPDAPAMFLRWIDGLMLATILLSAPVFVAMFLSELGLALVSRFAPQLQVFFLAMPVKSAVGIFVLIVYIPFFLDYVFRDLDGFRFVTDVVGRL